MFLTATCLWHTFMMPGLGALGAFFFFLTICKGHSLSNTHKRPLSLIHVLWFYCHNKNILTVTSSVIFLDFISF